MDLLELFKPHIGNRIFHTSVKFESALNDYQEVYAIRLAVILMRILIEHSLPKAPLSRLKTSLDFRHEWVECIHIFDLG